MAKAIKYIIMFLTMWVYIFGSFGFIVHNCYMSKSVYVSNSLISACSDMMSDKCEYNAKDLQNAEKSENTSENSLFIPASANCTESVHALDCYKNEIPSDAQTDLIASVCEISNSTDNISIDADINHYLLCHNLRFLERSRCSIDKLCTFLI